MKRTSAPAMALIVAFGLVWLMVCLTPFWQLVSVTFSTPDRGIAATFLPNDFFQGVRNVQDSVAQTGILPSMAQTFCYVVFAIFGMLLVCSLAAYELGCFSFPGRDWVFLLILSSMMLPVIVYVIPLFRFVFRLGLSDTLPGLAIPFIPSAFAVFIMRQFLESLPRDLIEAGEIDGASHFGIFRRIVLPLMKTPVMTVAIIQFMQVWGTFLWPTLVGGTRWKPVSVLIAGLLGDGSWLESRVKIAAMLVSAVPLVAVYLFCQRYIVEGIATSGLKS